MASRYICVINRNRDFYQVPLALQQSGLLETFVTDFYAPEAAPGWLPAPLVKRRIDGLPRARTSRSWLSFLVQTAAEILKLPMNRVFPVSDGFLAAKAGRIARRTRQAVYAYHDYVPIDLPDDVPLVVFAFHPMPVLEQRILEEDSEMFPEAAAALQREERTVRRRPIDWSRTAAAVCASAFTARSLIEDGCDPAKITIIPYGLPDAGHVTRKTGISGQGGQFLFVGQGIARKGLHHLIRAWQSNPPHNARLTIVSYRIEPEIAALIEHPSITLLAYLPREELDQRMEAADVFVMPSLVEGFGLVYLEALAHGCHIIGTRNSGLPDLALDDGALSVVEVGDLPGLSKTLNELALRASAGDLDRSAIAASAAAWTQARFRQRVSAHAAAVLDVESPAEGCFPEEDC